MSLSPHNSATVAMTADPTAVVGEQRQFTTVPRGYHKGEVDEWGRWALNEIERLGRQVASFTGWAAKTPEGQKLMSEIIAIVADEVSGQQQAAQREIEQMFAGAREQADQVIAAARDQASGITSSATQQASSLISGARLDAKTTTDMAEAHAAAVHEAAGQRLAQIVKLHQDTLSRVGEINRRVGEVQAVTAQVISAEQDRGDIGDEVTRALAPITPRLLVSVDVRPGAGDPAAEARVVH